MQIQSIGRNTNFGNLCKINSDEKFKDQYRGRRHEMIIYDLLTSDAFKKLGEKYDFDANLSFSYDGLRNKNFTYTLDLIPTEEPTPDKSLPNFPLRKMEVIYSLKDDPKESYAEFRKKLQKMNWKTLNRMVEDEVKEHDKKLNDAKQEQDEYNNAMYLIKNSGIPID